MVDALLQLYNYILLELYPVRTYALLSLVLLCSLIV
jgi:hypothetical protein